MRSSGKLVKRLRRLNGVPLSLHRLLQTSNRLHQRPDDQDHTDQIPGKENPRPERGPLFIGVSLTCVGTIWAPSRKTKRGVCCNPAF
jgi:hypothetical protein